MFVLFSWYYPNTCLHTDANARTYTRSLRQLLFGTSKGPSFSQEWRRQNFEFSDILVLVQHKVWHPMNKLTLHVSTNSVGNCSQFQCLYMSPSMYMYILSPPYYGGPCGVLAAVQTFILKHYVLWLQQATLGEVSIYTVRWLLERFLINRPAHCF